MRGLDLARVLVLGGAGFIGYHLTRHLAENTQDQITIVDNLSRGQLDNDLEDLLQGHPSVNLIVGDLTNSQTYDNLSGSFDQVYLLAGIVGVNNVERAPYRVLRTNSGIILNVFDWLARVGCGRLVFASTSEVYAGTVDLGIAQVPTDETVPVAVLDIQQPRSTYALTKMLGEAFVTHLAQSSEFEAVIVRFHNVYGPRMGLSHVVPELMQRIHKRMDPFPVYGLDQTRAFCYITDAVRACVALMECDIDGSHIVNVGNEDEEVKIRDLVDTLLNVTGFHPEITSLPAVEGSTDRRCPDIARLRTLTGFENEVDLRLGLMLTWEWYSERFDLAAADGSGLAH